MPILIVLNSLWKKNFSQQHSPYNQLKKNPNETVSLKACNVMGGFCFPLLRVPMRYAGMFVRDHGVKKCEDASTADLCTDS